MKRPGTARRCSWREAPAMPVGLQRPLARAERAQLERLRKLVDVQTQADRRLVACALRELVGTRDLARRDPRQEALDFLEAVKGLREEPARDAILASERVVGNAVRSRERHHLLVEPVLARTNELEVERE